MEPLQTSQDRMALLVDLSRRISSRMGVEAVLPKVVEYSITLTGAERGFLFIADGTDHMQVKVALDEKGRSIIDEPVRISSGVVSAMLAHGIPIFLEDVKLNDGFAKRRSILESGVQFVMGIPLKVKGRILGFVYVDNSRTSRPFQPIDRQLLTSFADQAALALENARLVNENRAIEQEAILGRISEKLVETLHVCSKKISECRRLSKDRDMDASLEEVSRLIEDRVREYREFREFVDDEIQISLAPHALDDLVRQVLKRREELLAREHIEVHASLNIGRSTLLDPVRLGRAIGLVVENAIDALAGRTAPLIAVTTAPVPEGLLVEVRDTGWGMQPGDAERVFEPFYSRGKRGRLGLGLTLARRIVEMHRGRIEFRSRPGEGTSVWIVIPSDLRPSLVPRVRRSSNPPPPRP